jgi:protein-tyrosine phosphatase
VGITRKASYVPGFRHELNLRELGGYVAADGRQIKKGIIYRSGALYDATDEELVALHDLGLRYILDLRSQQEADKEPNPQLFGVEQVRISGARDANDNEVNMSPRSIWRFYVNPRRKDDDEEENLESVIAETYSSLAFDNLAYRTLFEQLIKGNVPLLFHCSAGKDRTGVAAMLILLALGVDEKTVVEDYVLTNEYRASIIEDKLKGHPILKRISPAAKIMRATEGVLEHFGERVLSEIIQEYGSYEAFFEHDLGLDAEAIAALRDQCLE